MRKEQFICPYTVYEGMDELPAEDAALLRKAHEAAMNAHAPYSKFFVGAAVRLANGEIVQGNNIEMTGSEAFSGADSNASLSAKNFKVSGNSFTRKSSSAKLMPANSKSSKLLNNNLLK